MRKTIIPEGVGQIMQMKRVGHWVTAGGRNGFGGSTTGRGLQIVSKNAFTISARSKT